MTREAVQANQGSSVRGGQTKLSAHVGTQFSQPKIRFREGLKFRGVQT